MKQRTSCQWMALLVVAAMWACQSKDVGVESATVASSSNASDSVGSSSSTSASTSEAITTEGLTGTASTATTKDTCSESSCTGGPGPGEECDMYTQDCPSGYKCALYSSPGVHSISGAHCVPLPTDPKQVGESCGGSSWGGEGDLDDCDRGLMCTQISGIPSDGYICRPSCIGDVLSPSCPADGWDCIIYGGTGIAGFCMQRCDLLAQDCPDGQVCVPSAIVPNYVDVWCRPDLAAPAPPPIDGSMCMCGIECPFLGCGVGRMCFYEAGGILPDCQGSCCSSFCDLNAPNTCELAAQGAECVPFIKSGFEPPAGMENVGFCGLP